MGGGAPGYHRPDVICSGIRPGHDMDAPKCPACGLAHWSRQPCKPGTPAPMRPAAATACSSCAQLRAELAQVRAQLAAMSRNNTVTELPKPRDKPRDKTGNPVTPKPRDIAQAGPARRGPAPTGKAMTAAERQRLRRQRLQNPPTPTTEH